MSKLTKNQRIDKLVACLRAQGIKMRELETRLSTQEKWSDYADNMLTELNHALPDPEYDAKCEAEVADVEASLDRHRERLGLNKPQLKQLDQSVFDGLDEKWRFAAVNAAGRLMYSKTRMVHDKKYWWASSKSSDLSSGTDGYDTSNWQNSLIERDIAKELTGSDLARAMLARGDRWILCGNTTDGFASPCVIDGYRCSEDDLGFLLTNGKSIEPRYIHPVNNQGEPLTQAEAGL